MTSDRVGRLVSALHNIEEHLNGKSIILSRVLVYRKLVSQVKQPMINHSDWLLDLFTDMLSNIIDIRTNAVALGLDAGFLLNHDRALSRRVMEITALTFQDKRYIDYYREKLRIMLKDRRQAPAVPRIWSVVMLLVRCPFDKWDAFNDWLLVIQACFNSSDFQTRLEANQAWARLVYIALSDERIISDAKRRLSTLRRPFADQMNRKGTGKQSEDLRKAVLGGVCNLFYYAFRPNVSLALVDHYWDSGVAPTMRDLMDRSCEDTIDYGVYAAQILTNLFNCSRTRIWTRERVTDPRLVEPTELPAIDSKWIRRNVSRVFDVVEPILEKNFLALRSKSPTLDLWQALVSSVASAAIKEVKVATDTAAFVARSFNFLQSVWATGVPPGEAGDYSANFLCAVRTYLQVMFEALGQLPFTEKILSTNDQNKFVPISTPSHREAFSSVKLLWDSILHLAMEAGEPQQLIFALESLLVAAFNSPHKPIVNATPDEEVPHSQAALVPDGLAAVEDVDAELLRSPMQYSTQDSPFDASSHASRTQQRPEALDEPIMDVDSPRSDAQEALLQSQIALESLSQRDKEREAVEVKGAERSRREDQVHESVQVGQDQGASATGREEERAGREAVGKGHSIMETLRSGLKELKTAALSRTEVYEIESMFMDIKRELYEAELRGRASALNS
ncbi:hypothetical protein P8C59_007943 [Phyllachora maydis]|uniref:Telomere-associated protein Rif1 N-terminal domain-containing protein n=1 Tax=Phyllachora maydis TaxID=1825666 RepID=A0AAD9IAS6_9PEZI|nr:hypothetical protein P8C59_007943 [Phyllachora maydis]